MTRREKVLLENPLIVPEILVMHHCPAEYGLIDKWPPDGCPPGLSSELCRCVQCWNMEVKE